MKCPHQPPCPPADAADREAAHIVSTHPEQGWSLLCNGVITFTDTGELLPDGGIISPHRSVPARSEPMSASDDEDRATFVSPGR